MNSVEFIKNIKENSGLLVNFFDATMALYNLIGTFDGLTITNNSSAAEIRFTVDGDYNQLASVLKTINAMQISVYTTYQCNATMEGNSLIIILTEL
jgi:hypothetical protein